MCRRPGLHERGGHFAVSGDPAGFSVPKPSKGGKELEKASSLLRYHQKEKISNMPSGPQQLGKQLFIPACNHEVLIGGGVVKNSPLAVFFLSLDLCSRVNDRC